MTNNPDQFESSHKGKGGNMIYNYKKRITTKKLVSLSLFYLLVLLFLSGCLGEDINKSSDIPEEQYEFVSAGSNTEYNGELEGYYGQDDLDIAPMPTVYEDTKNTANEAPREIEEADIIKIDSTTLYILNQYRGLIICDISQPDNPIIIGRASITGYPQEMYISDDRAYIIMGSFMGDYYNSIKSVNNDELSSFGSNSSVIIFDIGDKSQPQEIGSFDFEGEVVDSRIVGNIIYVVSSNQPIYPYAPSNTGDDIEQDYIDSSLSEAIIQQNIYVASINISDPSNIKLVDREDFGGSAHYIHVAEQAIFIESSKEYYFNAKTIITYVDISDLDGDITTRGSIEIEGLIKDEFKMDYYDGYLRVCTYETGGNNEILIDNERWAINAVSATNAESETDENFDIQTKDPNDLEHSSTGDSSELPEANDTIKSTDPDDFKDVSVSKLHVIDTSNPDDLQEIGSVELGHGEQLFATRFDGLRAYMVTYEQKDPLWVIDLSNPQKPEIKGELIVPGWSTHIEPRGNNLIALGVDDTKGRTVSISLFDVSDPNNPGLIKRLSFGDLNEWSTSVAYEDVHAFTILDDTDDDAPGLILLPYSTYGYINGTYGNDDKLQLIDYYEDDIITRGCVGQTGSVLRSRSNANRLFSISNNEIQVIDADNRDNPQITASLTLALNITNFIPLDNGFGVQVINEDFRDYKLRVVPISEPVDGNAISELQLDYSNNVFIIGNGNIIYIIKNIPYPYESKDNTEIAYYPYYSGYTRIQVIDFSDAYNPRHRDSMDLPGSYSSLKTLDKGMPLYPYRYCRDIIQLKSDVLVFNKTKPYYYKYDSYQDLEEINPSSDDFEEISLSSDDSEDRKLSDDPDEKTEKKDIWELEQFNGFFIADLKDPNNLKLAAKIPIDIASPRALFAYDEILYFSYHEDISDDNQGRPQSVYYLGRIDLSNPDEPVEMSPINIPGPCLGLDDSGNYAYTINKEWPHVYSDSQDYSLNVVKIENDTAYLSDKIDLTYYPSSIVISNNCAYILELGYYNYYYTSNFNLKIIDLTKPDDLFKYEQVFPIIGTDILGAQKGKVFISTYQEVACFDMSDPDNPQLDGFKTLKSIPDQINFHNGNAYVPLGYWGLWVKNL